MLKRATIESPVGILSASFSGKQLCQLDIGKICADNSSASEVVTRLEKELNSYFSDKDFKFTIPVQLDGTDFQRKVWSALCEIPVGCALSYGQLAEKLQSSPRAIGNACRVNPVPIIIPCHRVVGKNGIGGYDGKTSGKRLDIKRWLLQHEGVSIS